MGRSKKRIFDQLKERIRKKLKRWKEKLFSFAGREILIKAVAQSSPSYIMSTFQLHCSLISDIHSMIARFWWGSKEGERKVHWIAWDKLCNAKADGGMGLQSLESFNTVLLPK